MKVKLKELEARYLNPLTDFGFHKLFGSESNKDLFDLAEIKQLTKTDMGKYRKSVLDYYDVQDAMICAREEEREVVKVGIIQKCLQKKMAIEDIIFITGYSKEQINRYSVNSTL